MSDGFEWLDWLEPSGPFLAPPVLKSTFPQGLGALDPSKRKALRQAYDEYREALEGEDPESDKFHAAWIDLVIRQGLEYDEDESGDNLKSADDLPDSLVIHVAEHGVTLKPDYAVVDDQNADKPMLLIQVYDQDADLNDAVRGDGWASSPRERMVRLCRDTGTRLGLITNGEHWLFVDAPVGVVSSFANWYARLWGPEPILLQAFVIFLGIRRFFLAADEQLPALIDKSVAYQDEVTAALGEQVRRAVEVLIQALDKADVDRNRELLKDVDPRKLYEAGLTVMMRLVFLLSAEERELLLLGDERYEANYAVSTLRLQLRGEDDSILQRRWDAWSRLLAIFRAIYGGVEHETLRMPALGGSLFDPDRFPFLEGRDKDSSWKNDPAKPLPIDNQTVLLLLDAIQLFEGRTLSYRGLDIEQLGYVYEGLLDHTVKRAEEATLELDATKGAKKPWVRLGELESARLDGELAVEKLLKERTGSSISRVRNDLKKEIKPLQSISLLTACHNDQALHDQLKHYFHLIRTDSWGRPMVYPEGSFMVTTGEDRRQTGSHYTPTSLTEAIVRETLEPVVYIGPAEGKPIEEWQLKSPEELLDLKICDPAMGSGAFLVQVCRWLGERVVESWAQAEEAGKRINISGVVSENDDGLEPMPGDSDERLVNARRLVAERCIYGVDLNPLAVELAKLSVWLVTLAKGRPFGFLDHNLRSGDSLLGICYLDQLVELKLEPTGARQTRLFGRSIQQAVDRATDLRRDLRRLPIRDIRDTEKMSLLDARARSVLSLSNEIAHAFIECLLVAKSEPALESKLISIGVMADEAFDNQGEVTQNGNGNPGGSTILTGDGKLKRPPFHWPIEYPEVFQRENRGFDAIIGNPPFLRGKDLSGLVGSDYREYLVRYIAENKRGSADLVVYFFLRANQLTRNKGCIGLIGTNTVAEGDSRQVGLESLLERGLSIYSAFPNRQWPGTAAVMVSTVHIYRGEWRGIFRLKEEKVPLISAFLSSRSEWSPEALSVNAGLSFQGSNILGLGFTIDQKEATKCLRQDDEYRKVIYPYYIGKDLLSDPAQSASRYVINFWDWPLDRSADGSWETADEKKQKEWLSEHSVPKDYPGKTASDYPELLQRVIKQVKPERDKKKRKQYREVWWQFAEKQKALYAALGVGEFVAPSHQTAASESSSAMCQAMVSKFLAISILPTNVVFSHRLVVFTLDPTKYFALLQSSIHEVWVRNFGSTLETRMSYTPSDVFETFPLPTDVSQLGEIGMAFYRERLESMKAEEVGMTKFYNGFHNPKAVTSTYSRLRDLSTQIDLAVIEAYGWTDIELNHDFHAVPYLPENDRLRFTIAEEARLEIISRLTTLNGARAAASDDVNSKDATTRSKGRMSEVTESSNQGQLEL